MFLFVKTVHENEGSFPYEYFGLVYFFSVGLSDMSLCVIRERERYMVPQSVENVRMID